MVLLLLLFLLLLLLLLLIVLVLVLLFPKTWNYAFTVLIYKKGNKKIPSNFRPITLQPVFAKGYSSLRRNRIYKFLLENNYIESKIQKGFWSDISDVMEHTEFLTYIINNARKKQSQALITLLDLQNAFGGVDHSLLLKVLDYHYVPVELKSLIKNYYHKMQDLLRQTITQQNQYL